MLYTSQTGHKPREGVDRACEGRTKSDRAIPFDTRTAIIALVPFLVKGALSLSILRAMRDRGFDVTVAYYMSSAPSLSTDNADDFADADRLLDMTGAAGPHGVNRLEQLVRQRQISLLVQVGAPQAYRQLPYLKERLPDLHILDTLYNPIGHTLNHFLYEGAFDGVIVESLVMRDYILANSAKPNPCIHLIESGVSLTEFTPSTRPTSMRAPLTLGYMGRMSPEKNPVAFVEIAERLHSALPELRFCIYGEGDMEAEIRARVHASPANTSISFGGYAPHARDALHSMDVLVVPSKLDGRPHAVMEANACGVPVIAAPVGGIPELIEDGVNGHLVKPSDHAEIERIVKGWLENPARFFELRDSSRMKAERDFDRQRMLSRYAAVFAGASHSIQQPHPVLTR